MLLATLILVLAPDALALDAPAPDAPAPVRLYPIDDRQRRDDFRRYTLKLEKAVTGRDARALRKLVDPEVIAGPKDSDKGWLVFVRRWHPEASDSPLWTVLTELLDIGFEQMHPQIFVSPYYAWKFPRDRDPRRHLVVVRDVVPVRAEPSRDSAQVATVAFEVVERLGEASPGTFDSGAFDWVKIKTAAGKEGYVASQSVRSPITPRAQFALKDGSWKLVVLD